MVAFDKGSWRPYDDRVTAFTIIAGAPENGDVVVGFDRGWMCVSVVMAFEAEVEVDIGWIEEFAGAGWDEVSQMEVFLFGVCLGVFVHCCFR